MDRWIGEFGVLGSVGFCCCCCCCCCDQCLKEEVGMAEVGRGSWVVALSSLVLLGFVGRRILSVFMSDFARFGSNFAGFCWSLKILGVWVRFC